VLIFDCPARPLPMVRHLTPLFDRVARDSFPSVVLIASGSHHSPPRPPAAAWWEALHRNLAAAQRCGVGPLTDATSCAPSVRAAAVCLQVVLCFSSKLFKSLPYWSFPAFGNFIVLQFECKRSTAVWSSIPPDTNGALTRVARFSRRNTSPTTQLSFPLNQMATTQKERRFNDKSAHTE
jgi:hypothetical protein